jgi:LPXTG-motif cell wall-anchored protein
MVLPRIIQSLKFPSFVKVSKGGFLLGLFMLAGLSACSFSLTGDVTPPPDYYPAPPTVLPTASGPVYPLVPPDPQQGAPIYAEKCVPCHGVSGRGDGPQAVNLPNPVGSIGSAETARQSIPAEWFAIITQGNTERFMMPFGNSLSDRQRWDVLAYVYTLSAPPEMVTASKAIFDAECAACHGSQGKGDGPKAASLVVQPADLTNQENMALKPEAKLFETITNGKEPDMPAFSSKLTDAQRWMVTSYLRALTFASLPSAYPAPTTAASTAYPVEGTPSAYPAPAETASAVPSIETTGTPQTDTKGSVSGLVTMGSGGPLPARLTVTLVGFDNMVVAYTQKADVQPDGSYQFNDVDMPTGRVFMASVEYSQAAFDSDVVHIQNSRTLDMPITLYDTSTDQSALVVESVHVLFDFSQPGLVQVIELLVITNPSDKMIIAAQPGQPVLEFAIPKEATNLQVDEGEVGQRYIQTTSGVGDTRGIIPGSRQHQVGFAYDLPYIDKLNLSIPIPLPAKVVTFILPTSDVKVQSSQLTPAGQQSAQGMVLNLYTASNVNADSIINLSLSGKPSGSTPANTGSSSYSIWIGAGIFVVALGLAGWLIFRSRRRTSVLPLEEEPDEEVAEDADALLDAIAALDDLHAAGKLPDPAYQERRTELKERLKEVMRQEGDQATRQ